MDNFSRFIADRYNQLERRQQSTGRLSGALASEFYEGSDWLNFGYWRDDTTSVPEACENLVDELIALMPNRKGLILDVGCGKGMAARQLCRHFEPENIFGINISREHLDKCRINAPDSTFFEMDATDMEFPDDSFEHIISVEAAFHFHTRAQFLREAYRILRPGGVLTLSDILIDTVSPTQPPENCVRDLEIYRELYLNVGFDHLRVMDATKQCLDGFHEAVLRFLRRKAERNEIHPLLSKLLKGRSKWPGKKKQTYVLVCCIKP